MIFAVWYFGAEHIYDGRLNQGCDDVCVVGCVNAVWRCFICERLGVGNWGASDDCATRAEFRHVFHLLFSEMGIRFEVVVVTFVFWLFDFEFAKLVIVVELKACLDFVAEKVDCAGLHILGLPGSV